MESRCMAVCIGKIRMQGLVDIADNGDWENNPKHPLYQLVKVEQVALPLYPQFGTQPNIYYIPPRWVPRPYLRQMFGPGVDQAIERYTNPSRNLLAILQLFRSAEKMFFRYEVIEGPKIRDIVVNGEKRAIFDDEVVGYDEKDREIARLRVHEALLVRDAARSNSI